MGTLKARTVAIRDVDEVRRERLFGIFHRYYDEVTREQFEKDFSAKDHVILLYDPEDGLDHGFSTLKVLEREVAGKKIRGVFSGDTVIEREYWGQGSLGVEFLKYLFARMAEQPFTRFYWFLISKGYKTYLLMANNFDHHWPRYEGPTPTFEAEVMREVSKDLFGSAYDEDRGLVVFQHSLGQLKDGVAQVTDELKQENPRVAFFEAKNPTWAEGTELVCLARMTWSMPFTYWWKVMFKKRKRPEKSPSRGAADAAAREIA